MKNKLEEFNEIKKEIEEFEEGVKVMNLTIEKAIKDKKLYVEKKSGEKYFISNFDEFEDFFKAEVIIFGLKELFSDCECQKI